MQHELSKGRLLDQNGNLAEAGFACSLVKDYDRNDIKAGKSRIKEWDYYYIGDDKHGIALTIDDNSYMNLASVTIFDFLKKEYIQTSTMHFLTFGKTGLPSSSNYGDVRFKDRKAELVFANDGTIRHLTGSFKKLQGKRLTFDITLTPTTEKTMVIATPFNKKGHFYYNQKRNNLKAQGYYQYGEEKTSLDQAYGVLDWGRGVWTYQNTWYWSSLNACQDGHTIGFNLGYGFGDTFAASENMFFFDDRAYKLNDVEFLIPKNGRKDDFLKPWRIVSKSGDINLTFTPVLNRKGGGNLLFIKSLQNQVYGYFDGEIKTEEGTYSLYHLLGFAEKVFNRW